MVNLTAKSPSGSFRPKRIGHRPKPEVVEEFVRFLMEIDEKICRPPRQAAKLLAFIVQLHKADIVRHRLVQEIVRAYEEDTKAAIGKRSR